jgi:hypothetical protein
VRDIAGGSGQRTCRQDVGADASATQPAAQLPDRRGQTLQGRRSDAPSPSGRDPRLDRDPGHPNDTTGEIAYYRAFSVIQRDLVKPKAS